MKKTFFTLMCSIVAFMSHAQDSTNTHFKIKDYSLKDYVAPDIRYKTLNVSTDMNGAGNGLPGDKMGSNYNGNVGLDSYSYRNDANFQGSRSNDLLIGLNSRWSKYDSLKSNRQTTTVNFHHYSYNRWYNESDQFIGIYPNIQVLYEYANGNSVVDTLSMANYQSEQNIQSSISFSVGTGRIQPVSPARAAMDILISLEKYNRLSKSPTNEQVDSLAKIANSIVYKRFFDGRFKRIYQLSELDKGIQEMGLVDNPDMVYAANLSDIWNYGKSYWRGAGSRYEVGVVPFFQYSNRERNSYSASNSRNLFYNYGFSGIVKWEKQVPINYAWQSNITVQAGYSLSMREYERFTSYQDDPFVTINSESIKASWMLGYYPNTRTGAGISPFVNLSAAQTKDEVENKETEKDDFFGMTTGFNFHTYYYISPRFRVMLNASYAVISDEYIDLSPEVGYISSYRSSSDVIGTNPTGNNMIDYWYNLKLSYAIF